MNAYDSIIHTSEKLETTQISFNGRMDRQMEVYPYNGIHSAI